MSHQIQRWRRSRGHDHDGIHRTPAAGRGRSCTDDEARVWTLDAVNEAADRGEFCAIVATGSAVRDVPSSDDLDLVVVYRLRRPVLPRPPISIDLRCYEQADVSGKLVASRTPEPTAQHRRTRLGRTPVVRSGTPVHTAIDRASQPFVACNPCTIPIQGGAHTSERSHRRNRVQYQPHPERLVLRMPVHSAEKRMTA